MRIHCLFVLSHCYIHLPSCFSKMLSYHWYLHITHTDLIKMFSNHTYWCTAYGLFNLFLATTGLFLFDIFLTLHVLFTLNSGSFSASCYSTFLDRLFRGLELYISSYYYSCALLSCILEPGCLALFKIILTISITNICEWLQVFNVRFLDNYLHIIYNY